MNGKLAISRTFGDRDFKRFGVTAERDIVRRELHDGDEYVILASDGVWDKLSNQNAMGVVRDSIAQCRRNPFETYFTAMSIDDDEILETMSRDSKSGAEDAEGGLGQILAVEAANAVLSLTAQELGLSALDLGTYVAHFSIYGCIHMRIM